MIEKLLPSSNTVQCEEQKRERDTQERDKIDHPGCNQVERIQVKFQTYTSTVSLICFVVLVYAENLTKNSDFLISFCCF